MPDQHYMSKSDASHIQSTQAKSGGDTGKGSFYARAQSAGDRNANASLGQKQGSGSRGNHGSGGAASKK